MLLCKKVVERAQKQAQVEANKQAVKVVFKIGDKPIENVLSFKYLGMILAANDNDLPAMVSNIHQACQHWGQISHLLMHDGASTWTMGYFYKAIVQAVLLYGSETWVFTSRMLKILNSFHHQCARYIAQDYIHRQPNGEWTVPRSDVVLQKCGLFSISEYVRRRKETVRVFVENRPIFSACVESIPTAANIHQKVWW